METPLSLLERLRTDADDASWQRLDAIYRPLLGHWLARIDPSLPHPDVEDLVQEVLGVVCDELADFKRGREGAFRNWLRTILVFRVRGFWRARRRRPEPLGDGLLEQLEDAGGDLSRQWDREHDRHVLARLLDLLAAEFRPDTMEAFRLQVLEGEKAADVASRLGATVNAVLLAKSRVLARLRQEARGLIG